MAQDALEALPLAALLRRGQAALAALQALPPAAPGAALQLQHGLAAVAHASRRVDSLALFSPDEVGEDIPTKDLRYLLLPALRADLLTHLHAGDDPLGRADALRTAMQQYRDFLLALRQYRLLAPEAAALAAAAVAAHGAHSRGGEGAAEGRALDAAGLRLQKIEKFKRERAILARLEALQLGRPGSDPQEEEGGGDEEEEEESERELWLLRIEQAALQAADRLPSLAREVELLQHAASLPEEEREAERPPPPPELMRALQAASRGLHGERDRALAGVFRPSHALPTLTVEQHGELELAAARQRQAREAEAAAGRRGSDEEEGSEEEEAAVQRARAKDDWNDNNPRGWGNSKTRPCG